jgi:hypothetical protein
VIAQVSKSGVSIGSERELEDGRRSIERDCCLRLPQFLAPELLHWFQERIARAEFATLVHALVDPPAVELEMRSEPILNRLHFLVNDARLFAAMEHVAGLDSIGAFAGRVYKMVPGQGHHDSWHHDVNSSRMMALSVNLGHEAYDGGVLQIMDWDTRRLISEVANTGPGDAVVFPLSMRWRHQITPVTGDVPKLAFAGWFGRQPRYVERVTEHLTA